MNPAEVTKIRKYYVILQDKTGKKKQTNGTHHKESHATKVTKIQKYQNEMSQTLAIGAAAIVVAAVTLPSTNQIALFTENVIKSSLISLS